ncbi:hypothetical protein [Maribellus mangrovi]|uniref:hypothetical protein n=1 Tax=Maribellus mangrovi TaxID=3133146 RepID=UPI0030EEA357
MKNTIILVILFAFSACQKLSYYEIIVENITEHDIVIEAFHEKEKQEEIILKAFESYTNSQYIDIEGGPDFSLFQAYLIDSVNIIFDSEKIIIQSCGEPELSACWDVQRNILAYGEGESYEYTEFGHKKYRYTYLITEEDYNNALPIEN